MRRLAPLAGLALVLALACYTDDTVGPNVVPGGTRPIVRVNLTDAPFPFDSVASVNVYVDSIEASAGSDSAGYLVADGNWVTLTAPHQAINLLNYQQGALAFLGQGNASAGQYKAVRMTIDVDSSSIVFAGGEHATVNWGRTGRVTLYALVSPAFTVTDSVSDLVLDFDVGRSFPYNLFGNGAFDFIPWLRAVNAAETGTIQGTVTTSYSGTAQPVENADVTIYPGDQPGSPLSWPVLATGRTDASGHYKVAFLSPGTYAITVQQPDAPYLATTALNDLSVSASGIITRDFSLVAAGAGNAGIHISGPNTVGVGGLITILASVTDSQGNPVSNPTVTWTSSDTTIAGTLGHDLVDSTYGKAAGTVYIRATTGVYSDSILVQVAGGGSVDTVATVEIMPDSENIPLSVDSLGFYAQPYSANHTPLYNRPIGWFVSDTTVLKLTAYGQSALITPLKVGTATVSATSEGKTGTAKVVIH